MNEQWLTQRPTPKRLILSLFSSPDVVLVDSARLISWTQLFDIEASTTRVAMGRLIREGLLRQHRRGVYSVGPKAQDQVRVARSWVSFQSRVIDWCDEWWVINVADLGRANKTQLRLRERALQRLGFAQHPSSLWCRPANLSFNDRALHARLVELGVEPRCQLMRVSQWVPETVDSLKRLWSVDTLVDQYQHFCHALTASQSKLHSYSESQAARETFILGDAVIKLINNDPMLPEPWLQGHRAALIERMKEYDRLGRQHWRSFLG